MNNPLSDLIDGNLAHLPSGPGPADPGWGHSQRWHMEGQTPSISTYDRDFGASDTNVRRIITNGMLRLFGKLPLSAPTLTRQGTVSAQLSSLPAARYFQSYTGSGTGQAISPGSAASTKNMLNPSWNPNQAGAAELHPSTTYDPFPSPASLYPKVV